MAAKAEAGADGRFWWPTGTRHRCRMLATQRPGSAARHGGTARPSARGRERGHGKGESAGGPGRLRPAGQK